MPRHQQSDVTPGEGVDNTTSRSNSMDSFQVPIKQKLLSVSDRACDMCGTFKAQHPSLTTGLILCAVFALGIVTSATLGRFVFGPSSTNYYVSTDPHSKEIHQALDTLIGHYRNSKDFVGDKFSGMSDKVKGASMYGYGDAKDKASGILYDAKDSFINAKDYVAQSMYGASDSMGTKLNDASELARQQFVETKDSILAAKENLGNKIQDALHPDRHENQFMKMVHEAEHKISNFIKQRGK